METLPRARQGGRVIIGPRVKVLHVYEVHCEICGASGTFDTLPKASNVRRAHVREHQEEAISQAKDEQTQAVS
jgi:hypothetical protein